MNNSNFFPQENFSKRKSDSNLFLPALLTLIFAWILHSIATFIPYWSTFVGIPNSRSGLWSAENFNYESIQNFYFPEPTDFPNTTKSIRFTRANTKGYLITVQYLMTFNFVVMFLVIIFLIFEYLKSKNTDEDYDKFFVKKLNTYETGMRFALLLYLIYVFGAFEFAAWITYLSSRHDDRWNLHVSFAFTIIVSLFLIVVFVMYLLEFLRTFTRNRAKWNYWYGPYFQWGFFAHLSALLLLLTVICCPEWAYRRNEHSTLSSCTLSDVRNNQSWINATQAFLLISLIVGMILLILIIIFRKNFRHDEKGYVATDVSQPVFTFVLAGLILFFCFLFTLIAISIFGSKTFRYSLTVNWAFIVAIISMVLFLISGILFILDGLHSSQQTPINDHSFTRNIFYPSALNQRALQMRPLVEPRPVFNGSASMNPAPFFPPMSSQLMVPSFNQNMFNDPFYVEQIFRNNQNIFGYPFTSGIQTMSTGFPNIAQRNESVRENNEEITNLIRQHILQQQRLNYNHERLLERYRYLTEPRAGEFSTVGYGPNPLTIPNSNQYDDGNQYYYA